MGKLKREAEFHNQIVDRFGDRDLAVAPYFEAPTAVENKYILSRMESLKGKKILDFGCGFGDASVYFALKGAKVVGIDVSEKALQIANRLAATNSVEIDFILSNKESLMEFSNENFDFIYGNGVLHHIDCKKYYPEFKRVLRPKGRAYFIEPLKYNPVINVYRKLAKEVRSPDENPLGLPEIRLARQYFKRVKTTGFWLFSLYLFCHFYLIEHVNPNKERYWRKIILEGERFKELFYVLHRIDQFTLRICPILKYLCWNVVVEIENYEK